MLVGLPQMQHSPHLGSGLELLPWSFALMDSTDMHGVGDNAGCRVVDTYRLCHRDSTECHVKIGGIEQPTFYKPGVTLNWQSGWFPSEDTTTSLTLGYREGYLSCITIQ